MTQSRRAVARGARRRAGEVLPVGSSPFRRRDFTRHPLFAALAPETFPETDGRGVVALRAGVAELRADPGWPGCRATRPRAAPSRGRYNGGRRPP